MSAEVTQKEYQKQDCESYTPHLLGANLGII